jgi:hypothetical protein
VSGGPVLSWQFAVVSPTSRRTPVWAPPAEGGWATLLLAHPVLPYLGGSDPRGIEVRPSRKRQKERRGGSDFGELSRAGAWTLRTYPPPVPPLNHVASLSDVVRRWFRGRTLWQTAPRGIPTEGVRGRASPSCRQPPPLVPGFFAFRARGILRTDSTDASDCAARGTGKGPNIPAP